MLYGPWLDEQRLSSDLHACLKKNGIIGFAYHLQMFGLWSGEISIHTENLGSGNVMR